MIVANKLALDSGWDVEILAEEFAELMKTDFEVDLTGFETYEIDQILTDRKEASTEKTGPEDYHPEHPQSQQVVTRRGDKWKIDRHELSCDDAKNQSALDNLLSGAKVDLVFIDPPYNVPIKGHVSGHGRIHHREFAEASGELTSAEFTAFLTAAFEAVERVCRNGAIVFTCMDWRHISEILAAGSTVFTKMMNLCVWSKTNGGMGSFYRSQHELVFVWKVGDVPHKNNFGLGDKGRYRTNVWSYAGVNSFSAERDAELRMHPTVKPVAMVADAIRDVSDRGDLVLDVFGGSGTTLIAAEKTGRRACLMEIDPGYCDVTIRRWQKLTGKRAILASTGEDFETVEAQRLVVAPVDGEETVA